MSPSTVMSAGRSPLPQAWPSECPPASDTRCDNDSDASSDEDKGTVPVGERCKYPGKFCGRARARKSDGTFHRLCQRHRERANANQKRWKTVRRKQARKAQQHRRVRELVAQGHLTPCASPVVTSGDPCASLAPLPNPVEFKDYEDSINTELSAEDVRILHALLGFDPVDVGSCHQHTTYESTALSRGLESSRYCAIYSIPPNFWDLHNK